MVRINKPQNELVDIVYTVDTVAISFKRSYTVPPLSINLVDTTSITEKLSYKYSNRHEGF
jgi:hypothetical protein